MEGTNSIEPVPQAFPDAIEPDSGVEVATTPEIQPPDRVADNVERAVPLGNEVVLSAADPSALGAVALQGSEADSHQQKPSRTEQVKALQQQITDAVETLVDAGAWQRMLSVAARFHDYSFGNQLLIALQRPDATRVAGYRAWQALGRQVRKGERGIAILAPMTVTIKLAADEPGHPSAEGDDARKDDAPQDDAAGDIRPKVLQRFRVVHVFDVVQTEGEALPGIPERLTGEADQMVWDGLAALVRARGYTIIRTTQGPDGYTSPSSRTVAVRADVEPAHATMVLMHELAHIACGHVEKGYDYVAHRGVAEVEAQSVAFVVAAAKGLDATAYTTDYVIGWAQGDVGLVRATAQKVTTVARDVLEGLDGA